jgi:hypothetical protein
MCTCRLDSSRLLKKKRYDPIVKIVGDIFNLCVRCPDCSNYIIVALVEQMLALHKQRAAAHIAADREMCQRQIDATDAQIDAVVYALPQGVDGGGDTDCRGRVGAEGVWIAKTAKGN